MSALVGFLLALLAQLMVLPTSWQQQHEATMTTTEITTAQQQQLLLGAAQAWITQNLATVQATATAAAPMVIPVSTLAAANVGLPASFSSVNPFGQTWQVQALQPTAGTLQVLVTSTNGTPLTDLQAAGIAAKVGQPGGFVPQNDSGVYPLGPARVYGNQANWNIPTAGYSGLSGGHPAALLVIANGQVQSNALYRVAVPGQPQLNQMQTAIDANSNDILNANKITAQNVVLPGAANAKSLQVGNSIFYGDGSNSAIRQAGGLYIQHADGSAADISQVANVNIGGNASIAGNTTMGANTTIFNPGTQYIETGGGNLYLKPFNGSGITVVGGGGGSGQLQVTGALTANNVINMSPTASAGNGCGTFGITVDGAGNPLACVGGRWTSMGNPQPKIMSQASSDTVVGPYNWCYLQGFTNPQADGTGFWTVSLQTDGGPNNRYFLMHNSKGGGGIIEYACF